MNSQQFLGPNIRGRKRAGRKAIKQRAIKTNKSEEYYNNIVVNIEEAPTPAHVVKLTPQSLQTIERLHNNKLQPQVQKPAALTAPKTPQQKFNEVANKHKALQMQARPNQLDFTADVTMPKPVPQQRQPPAATITTITNLSNNKGNKRKRPPPQIIIHHHGVTQNQPQPSQFQAPHQDEPEDLTDDLAPHTAGQGQSGTQPGMAAAENKLNFKFQKTAQKTPDWSEYQNKFRRIGGGSPGNETGDAPEIKQEKDDQPMNAGTSDERLVSIPPIAGLNSQQKVPPQAVVAPRVEAKPAEKPKQTESSTRPIVSRFDQKPQVPQYHLPSPYAYLYDNYPKGIPRSFLKAQENQWAHDMSSTQLNPVAEPDYQAQTASHMDLPSWIVPGQPPRPTNQHGVYEDLPANVGANTPAFVPNPEEPVAERAYSPSDVYSENRVEEEPREGSESPDMLQSGQKRLSAFQRLGPLTQPKKAKLTINLTLNKEQAVREVVDETDDESLRYVPVHLRRDIVESEDELVKKYLPFWPWKKNVVLRKTVSVRFSKSVMILEQEQMEALYEKDNIFILVSIKGYPKTWTKEDVLDAVLECVKGKTFIPLFVEFTAQECKFLVIRCRAALIAIHKVGFCIRKDDVELTVSISVTDTSLNQIDLIPRLVLRKRLMSHYDGEKSLDLKEFLQKDASHFVYFPLNRLTNQMELIMLMSASEREYITELNLSHNRITNLDGFNLCKNTPRLKHLDLSYNYLDKVTALIPLRELPLRSLKLEGNPLCHDYIDSAHYVKVVKMIFSEVMELDGVRIPLKGEFLPMKRNYGPEAAVPVVEKFLETFFPLLEAPYEDRATIEDMYDKEAVLTITFRNKLRYGTAYRYFRNLFQRSRCLEEGDMESVKGAASIGSLINKWPAIQHDRYTITVDVMHHDDSTTILRLGGVLKVIAESLAEDEHLLQFTRNIVLHTRNGYEYKIYNEMLYWDVPCEAVMETAFNITTVRPKPLSFKLDSPPDKDTRYKLTELFVKVADIGRKRGARCLEQKNWDFRAALEYYISLLKHGDFSTISFRKPIPLPTES